MWQVSHIGRPRWPLFHQSAYHSVEPASGITTIAGRPVPGPPGESPNWASHLVLGPDASAGRRSRAAVSPYMVQRAQSTTVLGKRWSLQKLVWLPPTKVRNALAT
ncbi:hypothetical protein ACFYO0_10750 [Streptomyces sp. NPDC006365]|uniref:hypothetical protein n=1 Tax=Streptomyces sp. NPDC006365 TaxID=3364744 RepID=UPI0036C30AD4